MAAYIPVSETEFAVVDLEDVPKLLDFGLVWSLDRGYAYTNRVGGGTHHMHRLLCKGEKVDHIDQDRLNNYKSNLRPATNQQNLLNRPKNANNTSGYKGVTYDKRYRKWIAQFEVTRARVYVGQYLTAFEAALAYDRAMTEWAGSYGSYNF